MNNNVEIPSFSVPLPSYAWKHKWNIYKIKSFVSTFLIFQIPSLKKRLILIVKSIFYKNRLSVRTNNYKPIFVIYLSKFNEALRKRHLRKKILKCSFRMKYISISRARPDAPLGWNCGVGATLMEHRTYRRTLCTSKTKDSFSLLIVFQQASFTNSIFYNEIQLMDCVKRTRWMAIWNNSPTPMLIIPFIAL